MLYPMARGGTVKPVNLWFNFLEPLSLRAGMVASPSPRTRGEVLASPSPRERGEVLASPSPRERGEGAEGG